MSDEEDRDEDERAGWLREFAPPEQSYVREQREALQAWDWRAEVREKAKNRATKFTDDRKAVFLRHFSMTERFYNSCHAAGISGETVRRHLKSDPDFMAAFEEARERYRDMVYAARNKALFEGYAEPIVGGKDKDEVVAIKQNFPFQVLLKELQRVDPAYRDKAELDLNMKGGVLVVPGRARSMEEWSARLDELKRQQANHDREDQGGSS